eukprot:jgi/Psemu1/18367/gm1.18367_g
MYGHNDTASTPNAHDGYVVKRFKTRALKRHEGFNGMTKVNVNDNDNDNNNNNDNNGHDKNDNNNDNNNDNDDYDNDDSNND